MNKNKSKHKPFFHPAMVLNFTDHIFREPKANSGIVRTIDFDFYQNGLYREIRCPQCDTIWIAESMEGYSDFKACHELDIMDCGHVLFRLEMIFDDEDNPHFFRYFKAPKESEFTARFREFYKKKIKNIGRYQYPDLAFYEVLFGSPDLFVQFGYDFLDTVFATPNNPNSDFRSGNKRRIIFGFQDEKKEIQRLFKPKL